MSEWLVRLFAVRGQSASTQLGLLALPVVAMTLVSGCEFVDAGGRQGNTPPVINAFGGTVDEGTLVVLDAGDTKDDFGEIASYRWQQVGGTTVDLQGATEVQASFTAPARLVPQGPELLSFEVSVVDRDGASSVDTIEIEVRPVNLLPEVDAGEDQAVADGTSVLLSGTATDEDGSVVSLQWEQISGPEVITRVTGSASVEFLTPAVSQATELIFRLTATDNETESSSDQVSVFVEPGIAFNHPPVADAGQDQTVAADDAVVVLDGRNSFDPDGRIVSYHWSIESGSGATLKRRRSDVAWLLVSDAEPDETIRIRLRVADDDGASALDHVEITVDAAPGDDDYPEEPILLCSISYKLGKVEGDKLKIKLTNNGTSAITMDSLTVSFPVERENIKKVTLEFDAYERNDSNNPVNGTPASFGPADWTEEDVSKRQIDAGRTETLVIQTTEKSNKNGRFEVEVTFAEGCDLDVVVEVRQIVK